MSHDYRKHQRHDFKSYERKDTQHQRDRGERSYDRDYERKNTRHERDHGERAYDREDYDQSRERRYDRSPDEASRYRSRARSPRSRSRYERDELDDCHKLLRPRRFEEIDEREDRDERREGRESLKRSHIDDEEFRREYRSYRDSREYRYPSLSEYREDSQRSYKQHDDEYRDFPTRDTFSSIRDRRVGDDRRFKREPSNGHRDGRLWDSDDRYGNRAYGRDRDRIDKNYDRTYGKSRATVRERDREDWRGSGDGYRRDRDRDWRGFKRSHDFLRDEGVRNLPAEFEDDDDGATDIILEGPYMFGYARLRDQKWPSEYEMDGSAMEDVPKHESESAGSPIGKRRRLQSADPEKTDVFMSDRTVAPVPNTRTATTPVSEAPWIMKRAASFGSPSTKISDPAAKARAESSSPDRPISQMPSDAQLEENCSERIRRPNNHHDTVTSLALHGDGIHDDTMAQI